MWYGTGSCTGTKYGKKEEQRVTQCNYVSQARWLIRTAGNRTSNLGRGSMKLNFGRKPRTVGTGRAAQSHATGFELLCDSEGTIVFGWANRSVLYSRFEGGLSAQSGRTYASRLQILISKSQSVTFFCDLSALQRYDLLARSAFVDVVRCNRDKFSSVTMLTWAEGISPAMQALTETLGEPIDVLTDGDSFEVRLLKAAPLASGDFDPKTRDAVALPNSGTRRDR